MLIKLDSNWTPTFAGHNKDILSTDSRRLLCKEANMNKANLTMYSKSLTEKGVLVTNENGGTEVNPMLIPEVVGDIVEYTFTLDMKE